MRGETMWAYWKDIFVPVYVPIMALGIIVWIGVSHFEARSFERLTGKHVSTFDAMFLQLRVQEPIIGKPAQ